MKEIRWDRFVASLNYKSVFRPSHAIRRWLEVKRIASGVEFLCEVDNGSETQGWPQHAHVRVEVLQSDVFRIRMSPGSIQDRPSDMLVQNSWPTVDHTVDQTPKYLEMATSRAKLRIYTAPWQIEALDLQDRPFFSQRVDDRAYGPGYEVEPFGFERSEDGILGVREAVAVSPGESFYGLGEKFTSLDKWGQEHRFWAVDSGNVSSFRSYKSIPFLLSSAGYGLFVHSSCPMMYRMGSQSNITYSIHLMDHNLDYFLIYGPSFKHILARYADLTGHAPLPPKWSYGFWISRCGYKSRAEVEEVVAGFRSRGLPCDVLSLDPWWMGEGPWTTLEWDTRKFPDPSGMMASLRDQGVRTCLWIHPYLPVGSSIHVEAAQRGYLVRDPQGQPAPVLEAFSGTELSAVDFTNPEARNWFQSRLDTLLEMGASVFKTDFGEQAPINAIYADGRSGLEMHNLYPLIYNRAVFELTERRFGRGLTWGRSAYAGSQRYPVQWGGDSYSSLDQLASQVRGLLSYGLSGVPFCSHDVGGFDYSPRAFDHPSQEDYPKDAETYLRWLQVGVFSSHLRAHGKQPREPWTYGDEACEIARRYLRLRYRLLPYLYTQSAACAQQGVPLVRPLVLEFQDDPNVRRIDTQFMCGDSLLIAPALTSDRRVQAYLPAGDWVDFWTQEIVAGGRWIEVDAPLETIPVWVRAGAIIPQGPEMEFVEQKPLDPLTLAIYAPSDTGELAILDEDRPAIPVAYRREAEALTITLGACPGAVELLLYGIKVARIEVDHQVIGFERLSNGVRAVFSAPLPVTVKALSIL